MVRAFRQITDRVHVQQRVLEVGTLGVQRDLGAVPGPRRDRGQFGGYLGLGE
jgi:hypothetical protein